MSNSGRLKTQGDLPPRRRTLRCGALVPRQSKWWNPCENDECRRSPVPYAPAHQANSTNLCPLLVVPPNAPT